MSEHVLFELGSSSSSSSDGVESNHGTPGTKVTEFSPEEMRGEPKTDNKSSLKSNNPPAFTLQTISTQVCTKAKGNAVGIQDPFTTSFDGLSVNTNASSGPKLSPTAATFKPGPLPGKLMIVTAHKPKLTTIKPGGEQLILYQAATTSSVSYLNATSVPDASPTRRKLTENILSVTGPTPQAPIGPPSISKTTISPPIYEPSFPQWLSATISSSRYLKIGQVPKTTSHKELNCFFTHPRIALPSLIITTELTTDGVIYVKFLDLRAAQQACAVIKCNKYEWTLQYITPKQFHVHFQPGALQTASDYEGQIMVTATCTDQRRTIDAGSTILMVKEVLERFGDLFGYDVSYINSSALGLRAEYYDVSAAMSAVKYLNGYIFGVIILSVNHYSADIVQESLKVSDPLKPQARGPLIVGQAEDLSYDSSKMGITDVIGRSSHLPCGSKTAVNSIEACPPLCYDKLTPKSATILTPSSPAYLSSSSSGFNSSLCGASPYSSGPYSLACSPWSPYNSGMRQQLLAPALRAHPNPYQQRGPIKTTLRQNLDFASGHHNVVEVERIRAGLDVRTTIMLRNIPNKVDQAMLKEIVDETSHGKYDFMYLRIDFANNCNVGYAFINFEDPYFIVDFVQARAGHRWNRFNSDKVAEVSYATIQGKDCLVQKFRNSSVMLENPSFRPKIFYTGKHPRAGEEEKFPGPDNLSKQRRSMDNAAHVGLFAPRAGQHFRDEQRRRRSQFDRGTRLAAIEDSYGFEEYDHHAKPGFAGSGYTQSDELGVAYPTY